MVNTLRQQREWPEFTKSMCEAFNGAPCLGVAASPSAAKAVTAMVDEAARRVAAAYTQSSPLAAPLPSLVRATFTSAANQASIQGCLAVHGRLPFLTYMDMTGDDGEEFSYVLDLCPVICGVEPECSGCCRSCHGVPCCASRSEYSSEDVDELARVTGIRVGIDDVVAFLTRIVKGAEPRAPQGAKPPMNNLFSPTHGVVLSIGKCAVTSTFEELKYSGRWCLEGENMTREPSSDVITTVDAAAGNTNNESSNSARSTTFPTGCGSVCVCWSDRCPCCPGVLHLVESITALIHYVTDHHFATEHPPPTAPLPCAKALLNNGESTSSTGPTVETSDDGGDADFSPSTMFHFPYFACNIDDNDLPAKDWPTSIEEQIVPAIVAYTATTGERVRFTGERTVESITAFLCKHCLPPGEMCACMRWITQEAVAIARGLSEDDLMRTLDESEAAYKAAETLCEEFNDSTDEARLSPSSIAKYLDSAQSSFAAARRPLVNMEEVVKAAYAHQDALRAGSSVIAVSAPESSQGDASNGLTPADVSSVRDGATTGLQLQAAQKEEGEQAPCGTFIGESGQFNSCECVCRPPWCRPGAKKRVREASTIALKMDASTNKNSGDKP